MHTPREKTRERICTITGSKRVKSANDVLFGVLSKMFTSAPLAPKLKKFGITKAVFHSKHDKSWRKHHQNSYSNRKQPMGISNLGLKIWLEIEFWPFLRVRSRRLANIHEIVVNFQNFPPYRKSGTSNLNLGSNFTLEVVLWPILHTKSGQNGSNCSQIGKNSCSVLNRALWT